MLKKFLKIFTVTAGCVILGTLVGGVAGAFAGLAVGLGLGAATTIGSGGLVALTAFFKRGEQQEVVVTNTNLLTELRQKEQTLVENQAQLAELRQIAEARLEIAQQMQAQTNAERAARVRAEQRENAAQNLHQQELDRGIELQITVTELEMQLGQLNPHENNTERNNPEPRPPFSFH
jgi:Spy/CpxP family protein refolding chaperone